MESMIRGVPLSRFPATLRDAVTITRKLGIQHLWVDALCIKQDSEEDWLRESSRMRGVYKGAVVTLIAGNSPTVNTGIFSVRTSMAESCLLSWNGSDGVDQSCSDGGRKVYVRACNWNRETEHWPIQQRGWALQEDLLSPRTLSYSKHRMIWECSTCRVDEGGRLDESRNVSGKNVLQDMLKIENSRLYSRLIWKLSRFLDRIIPNPELFQQYWKDPYSGWTTVVREYTSRNLTKETDMLPGIAGLASEFARQTRDKYCAGLWRKKLLTELMWNLDPFAAVKNQPPLTGTTEYRAPSWSWAAIRGATIRMEPPSLQYPRSATVLERAKILEARVELLTPSDPFGQAKAGHLILQGKLYPIGNFLESDESTAASGPLPAVQKVLQASVLVAPATKPEFYQQHKPCERQRFALFQLIAFADVPFESGADYLVLESTTTDADVYRRISCITLARDLNSRRSGTDVSPDDPFAFRSDKFVDLVKAAYRELQEANAQVKKVRII
jgi:Heterokaryon incompatibility protein (HET)